MPHTLTALILKRRPTPIGLTLTGSAGRRWVHADAYEISGRILLAGK